MTIVWKAEWNEDEHPRDADGRFGDGGYTPEDWQMAPGSSQSRACKTATAWQDDHCTGVVPSAIEGLATLDPRGVNDLEEAALSEYSDMGYKVTNEMMRNGQLEAGTGDDEEIDAIQSAIDKNTIDKEAVVFRGITSPKAIANVKKMAIGETFTDHAFVSTSLVRSVGQGFATTRSGKGGMEIHISVPAGSHAVGLAGGEGELLFGANSTFRLDALDTSGPKPIARMTYVGADPYNTGKLTKAARRAAGAGGKFEWDDGDFTINSKAEKAEGVEVVALHEILPSAGIVWKSVGFGEERILWRDFLKEWDPEQHPRGPDGRFGDGDGNDDVAAARPPLDAKSMTDEEVRRVADPEHVARAEKEEEKVYLSTYKDGRTVQIRAVDALAAEKLAREYGKRFMGGAVMATATWVRPEGAPPKPEVTGRPKGSTSKPAGEGRPPAGAKPDNTVGKEVGSILAVTQTRQFENDGQYGGPKVSAGDVRSAIRSDRDSNVVNRRLLSMSNTLNDRADRADKVADTLARVGDRKNEDRVRAFSDQCRAASATARDAAAQYDPDVYGRPAAADIAAEKACKESSAAQSAGDKMAQAILGERQAALTAPDRVTTGRDYGMQGLAAQAGDVSKFSRDMAMKIGRKGTFSETEARATAESHINTAVELGAMAASAQLQQLSAQRDGDITNLARLRDMEHSFRQAAAAHNEAAAAAAKHIDDPSLSTHDYYMAASRAAEAASTSNQTSTLIRDEVETDKRIAERSASGFVAAVGPSAPSGANAVSFGTMAEAEAHFAGLGIKMDAADLAFDGVSPQHLATIAEAIANANDKYPGVTEGMSAISFDPRGSYGAAVRNLGGGQSELILTPIGVRTVVDPAYCKRLDAIMAKDLAEKGMAHNATRWDAPSLYAHEMGHVVQNLTKAGKLGTGKLQRFPLSDSGRQLGRGDPIAKAMQAAGWIKKTGGVNVKQIKQAVSTYATKNSVELHAELTALLNDPQEFANRTAEQQKQILAFQSALNTEMGANVLKADAGEDDVIEDDWGIDFEAFNAWYDSLTDDERSDSTATPPQSIFLDEATKAVRINWKDHPIHSVHDAIVAHYTPLIAKALAGSITGVDAAIDAARARITKAAAPTPDQQAAIDAIRANVRIARTELNNVLRQMVADSAVSGSHVAATQIGIGGQMIRGLGDEATSIDWGAWSPGWAAAADLTEMGGLARFLNAASVTIKGMDETDIARLGSIIADGLANGSPTRDVANEIAAQMGNVEDIASRAYLIADTETARAMCAATEDTYAQNDIEQWEWLAQTAEDGDPDDRVCEECLDRDGETYDVGGDDPIPPQHPRCRCAMMPVVVLPPASGDESASTDVGSSNAAAETTEE